MVYRMKLDEIDIKILKQLLNNSRTSFDVIAQDCQVSALTIKNRYNRLKEKGVIEGSTIIANQVGTKTGGFAIFLLTVENGHDIEVLKSINGLDNSRYANNTTLKAQFNERYNIVWGVPVKSFSEIQRIKNSVKKIRYVRNIEVNIVEKELRFSSNLNLKPIEVK